MPITFSDKKEAKEYALQKITEGYRVSINTKGNTWQVSLLGKETKFKSGEYHYVTEDSTGRLATAESPKKLVYHKELPIRRAFTGWEKGVEERRAEIWDPDMRVIDIARITTPEILAHEIAHSVLQPYRGHYKHPAMVEMEAVILTYHWGKIDKKSLNYQIGDIYDVYIESGFTHKEFEKILNTASENIEYYIKTGERK